MKDSEAGKAKSLTLPFAHDGPGYLDVLPGVVVVVLLPPDGVVVVVLLLVPDGVVVVVLDSAGGVLPVPAAPPAPPAVPPLAALPAAPGVSVDELLGAPALGAGGVLGAAAGGVCVVVVVVLEPSLPAVPPSFF